MSYRKTVVLACLLTATAAVSPAAAEPQFGERIEVHLVTVEVAVESKFSRRPIADLELADFQVFEDGEPRLITHFERVQAGTTDLVQGPRAASASGGDEVAARVRTEAPRLPRQIAIAFDFGTLRLPYLQRTIRAAQEFVREDPDPNSRYSVMLLGTRPDVLLPFTDDRDQIAAALDYVATLRQGRSIPVPALGFSPPARYTQASALYSPQQLSAELGEFLDTVEGNACVHRALRFSRTLSELFLAWPAEPGSRSLVLFYEPESDHCKERNLVAGGGGDGHRVANALQTASRLAVASSVKVYATQATGLSNPANRTSASRVSVPTVGTSPPANLGDTSRQQLVDQVAYLTGGQHVNVNDLSRGLAMASETSRNHYRLSFQVERAPDGATHRIEVKVAGFGEASVRYPKSYDDVDDRTRLERQLRTSANIPKRGGVLPVSVRAGIAPATPEGLPVRATLSVPFSRLGREWTPEAEHPAVDLYVGLYAANGDLIEIQSEPWEPDGSEVTQNELVQSFEMVLPPGPYTIALAAYDRVTGRYGVDYAEFQPPAARARSVP